MAVPASLVKASAPVLVEHLPGRLNLRALHALAPERYPFLLESAAGQRTSTAGYDFLFVHDEADASPPEEDFAAGLDARFHAQQLDEVPALRALPFIGGWFLFLGYELAAQLEPRLRLARARGLAGEWPLAFAARCRAAAIVDHARERTLLVVEADQPQAAQQLAQLRTALLRATATPATTVPKLRQLVEPEPAPYLDGVARIKEYIRAGDIFQANLSHGWRGTFDRHCDPLSLYAALARANPAPFAALARWGEHSLLSSSPERLFRVADGRIDTRPIAGTRPRGRLAERERRALAAHPKERAEHVMLLDLERNDLGRVCETGSVRVDEFMTLESYAHVHHIVSNVSGTLRRDWTPGQVLRALFPGGTITGCPKIRSMEIIAELEGAGRGPYTGAVGYLDRRGRMDCNILIRSLWLHGSRFEFRTGAGIVADSVPAREFGETRAKARGLLRAVGSEA